MANVAEAQTRGGEWREVGWAVTIPGMAWKGFNSYPETYYICPSLTMLLMGITAHGCSHREYTTETTFTEHLL